MVQYATTNGYIVYHSSPKMRVHLFILTHTPKGFLIKQKNIGKSNGYVVYHLNLALDPFREIREY